MEVPPPPPPPPLPAKRPTVVIPPNARYRPQDPADVSSDTSSEKLEDVRARIFVGCLNIEQCTRYHVIQLFSMYGPLKGVSYFPNGGYAFVQYENQTDAEDAVLYMNRFILQGMRIDVRFVRPKLQYSKKAPAAGDRSMTPQSERSFGDEDGELDSSTFEDDDEGYEDEDNSNSGYASSNAEDGPSRRKRFKRDSRAESEKGDDGQPSNKEAGEPSSSGDKPAKPPLSEAEKKKRERKAAQRKRRVEAIKEKIFRNVEDEEGAVLDQNELPDVMICGGCHLITSKAQFFYEHRLRSCDRKIPKKFEDEPANFPCFQCGEKCHTSWELLSHMTRKHRVCLYKENELQTIEYPDEQDPMNERPNY